MKKLVRLLAALLAVIMIGCVPAMAASPKMRSVPTEINFHQSEARRVTGLINAYRTDSSAWYWDQNSKVKVPVRMLNISLLSYDYALEQIAMQRLAEILYGSYLKDPAKRPDGSDPKSLEMYGQRSDLEVQLVGPANAQEAVTQMKGGDENYAAQPYRAVLLYKDFGAVGAAFATVGDYNIWVLEFAKDNSGIRPTKAVDEKKTVDVKIPKDVHLPSDDKYELKQKGSKYVLLRNGKQATDVTGLVPAGAGRNQQILYFKDGVYQQGYSGLVKGEVNGETGLWKVKKGVVDVDYTGPYQYNGTMYTVTKGYAEKSK